MIFLIFSHVCHAFDTRFGKLNKANTSGRKAFITELLAATVVSPVGSPKEDIQLLPCADELDKKIFKLALPAILNLAILPLVGAADTFWVGILYQKYRTSSILSQ